MDPNLTKALICIVFTLLAYTLAVMTISKEKKLKPLCLLLLWLAFCGSAAGAGLLKLAIGEGSGFVYGLRGFCTITAIVLLFVHAIWATALIAIPDEKSMRIFLRDSKLVWKIWIVFFALGIGLSFI